MMKTTVYLEAETLARSLAWFNSRKRDLTEAETVEQEKAEDRLDYLWLEYFSDDEKQKINSFCADQ